MVPTLQELPILVENYCCHRNIFLEANHEAHSFTGSHIVLFPMSLELMELQKNFTSVSEILIMLNLISSYRFSHILK